MASSEFIDNEVSKKDLQQQHYALLSELQNMSRDLPLTIQQRLPYDLLSSLANSLLDKTVFDIVRGLKDIQQMTEKSLFEKRIKVVNSHKGTREKLTKHHKESLSSDTLARPHNVHILKAKQEKEIEALCKWQEEEINRLDMKIVTEMDQIVSDQQVTLEKVGVPGFFVSNKASDIKLQMHLQEFIAILGSKCQGIVMDRCVYSDRVFLEAMHTCGYIKKNARDYYADMYNNCMEELMRPHLIIYLDVSSETVLKRIQERNNPIEVNSTVLNKKYLDCLEYEYKQNYLPKMEKHADLIVYDWTNYGDSEVVIEDIERIDFNRFEKYDDKMKDWRRADEWDWSDYRRKYTNQSRQVMHNAFWFCPEIPELCPPQEDYLIYRELMMKVPGERYCEGFNPKMGDKVLFKTQGGNYRWAPYLRFYL